MPEQDHKAPEQKHDAKKILILPQNQAKDKAKGDGDHADPENKPTDPENEEKQKKLKLRLQHEEFVRKNGSNMERTDTWSIPVVDFDQEYDHIGYTRQALLNDIDAIKIQRSVLPDDKEKPFCKLNDWAVIHYKAIVDGKITEDSRTFETKKPRVFRLGRFEVSKCWDIALQ